MIRTQVYLTEPLSQHIKRTALHEKKPEAQVMRELIEIGISHKKTVRNSGTALLDLTKHTLISDDPNLSQNIDAYLYEDK